MTLSYSLSPTFKKGFFFILWLCVSACMYVYVTHTSLVPEGARRERWILWLAYKYMDFIRTHTCETILRHLSPPQLLGNLLPLSNRPSFSFHDTGSPLPSLVLPFSLYSPYAPLYFHARCRFICVYVYKSFKYRFCIRKTTFFWVYFT